jgi:WhiB family transcriptional regulator, redox-sensing transcriptional regulator
MSVARVETWQQKAACRGPQATSVFFPPSTAERKDEKEAREARAKAVCGRCAVRRDCLEYALDSKEAHGIWGGTNEVERKALLARRSA